MSIISHLNEGAGAVCQHDQYAGGLRHALYRSAAHLVH